MPPRSRRPLRGKYREVEVLKQVGKFSNVEIAEKLGVTEGAIRYRLKREAEGRIDGRKRRSSQLDRYRAIIEDWIEDQKGKRLNYIKLT